MTTTLWALSVAAWLEACWLTYEGAQLLASIPIGVAFISEGLALWRVAGGRRA